MDDKLLLLGLLRGQQMHGYQLFEFIEGALAVCTDLKKPTAYYLLNKMAQDGWIEERQEQEGNRPPRKVYRLTQEGEAQFQRLLRENLAGFTPPPFAGDIGLAFSDAAPPGETVALLQQRRQVLHNALQTLQRAPQHAGAFQLLLDHQRHFLSSELDWLDHVIKEISA
jgi:DNA-binding PadR family transcriptional regulator